MTRPALTYKLAHATGWDAGKRSMRAAGRIAWNEADWSMACAAMARLMAITGGRKENNMITEKCNDCDKRFEPDEKRFTFSKSTPDVEQSFGPYCQGCRDQFIARVRADGREVATRYGEPGVVR
jgi:hypothetical protein